MENRYNELTKLQQARFDAMINSVASHKNNGADRLTEELDRYLWTAIRELGVKYVVAVMLHDEDYTVRRVHGPCEEMLASLVWSDESAPKVGCNVQVLLADFDTVVYYQKERRGWKEIGSGYRLDNEELADYGFGRTEGGAIYEL